MNRKIIVTAIVASLLASTGTAFAQDRDERGHDRDRGHDRVVIQERHDDRGRHEYDRRDYDRRDPRSREYVRIEERGAGPYHYWHRGDRLPPEIYHRQYIIEDWRVHGLYAPPRGAYWVQSGGDYLLVAIATGIVLNTILYH